MRLKDKLKNLVGLNKKQQNLSIEGMQRMAAMAERAKEVARQVKSEKG